MTARSDNPTRWRFSTIRFSRSGRFAMAAALTLIVGSSGSRAAAPAPALPVEDNDVAVLSPAYAHRLFLWDPYYAVGVNVIDADDASLRTVGMIDIALNGSFVLNHDASRAFVVETYWSHGNRGDRADLLSIYDARKLTLLKEVALPGRFLAEPKNAMVSLSTDEKLAYVYDMIPNSQVYVIDVAAGKIINTIDMSGCWLAYAYGPRSFATICGDGTVGVARVQPDGSAKPVFSAKFFDADKDPVFENSVVDRATGEAWFLSFTGEVYPARLGAAPEVGAPWSIAEAAGLPRATTGVQDVAWRPGGAQMIVLHHARRELYVLMHEGKFWTHKEEGTEVWVLDADAHKLLHRIKLSKAAKAIAVTQDDHPLLIASGGAEAMLGVYDATTGVLLRQKPMAGHFEMVGGQ